MAFNEKGMSLVEVLAAVVILSIIFVGIMTIFPQMTLFNSKTETKLDTMNLARQEISLVSGESAWIGKRNSSNSDIYENFKTVLETKMPVIGFKKVTQYPKFIRYEKVDNYRYEADVYTECQPFLEADVNNMTCNDPSLTQLYKVHLKVYDGARISSQTYSYIKFLVEEKVD
ncbi:type IV pilus modification PilV family protein [Planococcus donghaensis]|uniref:Prepilin-type N-terminal cleavage/methylation domain-containing protein n=1 Tax=Planococcus donghaensis TaxID=414778 RepID=A0A1C7EIW4_9BACL|nr:type II secretion system protein [Planococcus donghaensis]ANU23606.1 hypothetical protein BCM40_09555 [Planococcus donghaensis]